MLLNVGLGVLELLFVVVAGVAGAFLIVGLMLYMFYGLTMIAAPR